MSKINAIETMSNLLGSNYQIISNGTADPVVLTKLPDEDLAPKNTSIGVNDKTPEYASAKNALSESESVAVGVRGQIRSSEGEVTGETKYEFRRLNLIPEQTPKKTEKTTDDYMFQFYLGSLTVVGLFVLFRMIQKSR